MMMTRPDRRVPAQARNGAPRRKAVSRQAQAPQRNLSHKLALAAVAALVLGGVIAACELDAPAAAVRTFQIRVEFEGGVAGSYAATFESPAGNTFTDSGGGVFLSAELSYADAYIDDPAVVRIFAERNDPPERLAVTVYQIETYMTPPGEQVLKEVIYEADGTEGASDNPSLEIDLTLTVPRS